MDYIKIYTSQLDSLEAMPPETLGRLIPQILRYVQSDGLEEPEINPADKLAWVVLKKIADPALAVYRRNKANGDKNGQRIAAGRKPNKAAKKPTEQPKDSEPAEPSIMTIPGLRGEFGVTASMIKHWQELYPGVVVLDEIRKMIGWCESNPAQRKVNVSAFVNRWLSKAQDSAKKPASIAAKPPKTVVEQKYHQREYTKHTDPMDWMKLVDDQEEGA